MDNTDIKISSWKLVKKLLVLFEFTAEQIKQVEFDLTRIAQIEAFSTLLVGLPAEKQQEIEQKIKTLTAEEANIKLRTELNSFYTQADIENKLSLVGKELLEDYLKNMLEKVTDPVKQDKVAEVIAELAKTE